MPRIGSHPIPYRLVTQAIPGRALRHTHLMQGQRRALKDDWYVGFVFEQSTNAYFEAHSGSAGPVRAFARIRILRACATVRVVHARVEGRARQLCQYGIGRHSARREPMRQGGVQDWDSTWLLSHGTVEANMSV